MELLNKSISKMKERPIKVVQFGEGNFLRGFVDYMLDVANEKGFFDGNIVLVKPIEYGNLEMFHKQECQYTVYLRGIVDGKEAKEKRSISSVADAVDAYLEYEKYSELAKLDSLRFVVSNTTEAGIVYDETDKFELNPPKTFPGKLTKFLYERYKHFNGDRNKGLIMLPVELIDNNGKKLKECVMKLAVLWKLEAEFSAWIQEACEFCSTLVDRIVTGFPSEEANAIWDECGYKDQLIVTAETFALWVIESERDIKGDLPLDKAGLPVIFTNNQAPYKERKVRILNGAHTSFVLASFLAGNNYVLESMNDNDVKTFMEETIFEEVIPTLSLSKEECEEFAKSVVERFYNPYIKHALLAISLNSVSKWRARCMPSLLKYVEKFNKLPKHLTFSIASLIAFYSGRELKDGALTAYRKDEEYKIRDDQEVLEFFRDYSCKPTEEIVEAFLKNENFFGCDLTEINGLMNVVISDLNDIKNLGMRTALQNNLK
ncbi:tagaturonate reductase [Anaeromicropila populeti]|uniref:Tagaturonate reductase n=1 Tax=Anaeromicropila populeti TaxID=37658 RepID=A0A1I6I919_9FIRM|nr:tagaturonate reductase [Anaeromicropila populeti]SFR63206.1 tagaturonate reductase [Anaeromicropila populeti]